MKSPVGCKTNFRQNAEFGQLHFSPRFLANNHLLRPSIWNTHLPVAHLTGDICDAQHLIAETARRSRKNSINFQPRNRGAKVFTASADDHSLLLSTRSPPVALEFRIEIISRWVSIQLRMFGNASFAQLTFLWICFTIRFATPEIPESL